MPSETCAKCTKHHPQVGDYVAIFRTDHGWFDGRLSGTVKDVQHLPTGRVSYTIAGSDGLVYWCPRTGDCKTTVKP
jgi:hypothetical protein